MTMKRVLALLMVFVLCFGLMACRDSANDPVPSSTGNTEQTETTGVSQDSQSTPLLYRVTDANGNVLWLFGSIHVGREDFYPLPSYVLNAFEGADSLAVELDLVAFEKDIGQQMKALTALVYTDGSTIKDHIPQELYEKAVGVLRENGAYMSAMDMYCPAFWGTMIDSLLLTEGGDADLGIDKHLINLAYEAEKEILEIESAELQYKMLADFDDDIQLMLLASAVNGYENKDEAIADLDMLMDLWASGDEGAFTEYLNSSDSTMTEEEKEIYGRYTYAMITARNLTMADYAEQALASGKEVFICVGAAHIVGQGALVELLTQRGYTVERVGQ